MAKVSAAVAKPTSKKTNKAGVKKSITAYKKRTGAKGAQQKTAKLEKANWQHWRDSGFVRLWQAAMLSLNYEPTKENKDALKETNGGDYNEYLRRRRVLTKRYDHHQHLTKVEHQLQGGKVSEKYVGWDGFINFSREIGWRELTLDEQTDEHSKPLLMQSPPDPTHVFDEKLLDDSRVIFLGSLLDVFERVLIDQKKVLAGLPRSEYQDKKEKTRHFIMGEKKNLNTSLVGDLMIHAIGSYATEERGFRPSNVKLLLNTARTAFKKSKNSFVQTQTLND